jgi:uncharacterized oligopeptide transporter (OPT) family protein
MQIMGRVGIAPNTSLISAIFVMIAARIPLMALTKFRNIERQNYVLSFASAAGFAAANCGFVAIAMMFILGRHDLILPMALGGLLGGMISVFVAGKLFDSKIFPAEGAWPLGAAVANSIKAGDEGGKKGFQLMQGLIIGTVAGILGIPAAGVGIAFIANIGAMAALGTGMVLRGYSAGLFRGFDIGESNIAQGMMIGAGIVAFIQIFFTIAKGRRGKKIIASAKIKTPVKEKLVSSTDEGKQHLSKVENTTVSDSSAANTLLGSFGLFITGAVIIAFIMGVFSEMELLQSVFWVLFVGISAIAVMILVGTASMHSGWAPTFAVVTIFMTFGIMLGFPPLAVAVLVGYLGSVSPCLADTAIGLKAGWIIRGKGEDKDHEAYGRKQQVLIKLFGVIIGIFMAVIFGRILINGEVIPPMSIFYANTVGASVEVYLLRELAIWAIPGAVLQFAFGSRSIGLMLATGLLVNNPVFGISILVALAARLIIGTKHMVVRAPGIIAGDGLFGFGANIFQAFF